MKAKIKQFPEELPAELIGSRRSFFLPGGPRGVLLLHGLTGSPHNLSYLGWRLNQAGYTVKAPLLTGHGGTLKDLERSTRADWYASTQTAYRDLAARCDTVYVAGISMGGLLTLRLAREFGSSIRGVALYAAPMRLKGWRPRYILPLIQYSPVRYFYHYSGNGNVDIADKSLLLPDRQYNSTPLKVLYELRSFMREEKARLKEVRQPALIMHSRQDHRATLGSAYYLYDRLGAEKKELILLSYSYHVITLDRDRELVARATRAFFDYCK